LFPLHSIIIFGPHGLEPNLLCGLNLGKRESRNHKDNSYNLRTYIFDS
jgi:hypothetical protein